MHSKTEVFGEDATAHFDAHTQQANANVDDGSCEVAGCMDPFAPNYKPSATFDDKNCAVYFVGCTDPAADNWRRIATVDDGSCFTTVLPPSAPPPPPSPQRPLEEQPIFSVGVRVRLLNATCAAVPTVEAALVGALGGDVATTANSSTCLLEETLRLQASPSTHRPVQNPSTRAPVQAQALVPLVFTAGGGYSAGRRVAHRAHYCDDSGWLHGARTMRTRAHGPSNLRVASVAFVSPLAGSPVLTMGRVAAATAAAAAACAAADV